MMTDLLNSLMDVPRWNVTRYLHGSCHHTLVGLLADGWISIGINEGKKYRVLDEAPRYRGNEGGGDIMLMHDQDAVGISEIEGGWPEKSVKGETKDPNKKYSKAMYRIKQYFENSERWGSLKFAIYVAYPTAQRKELPMDRFISEAIEIIRFHPEKEIIILGLNRKWNEDLGMAFYPPYYDGLFYKLNGALVCKHTDGIKAADERIRVLE